MMGRQASPARLFYDFSLDEHVPADHLLRQIDVFVDLEGIRQDLKPYYSSIGRPSIDPELMIRMLIIGYCLGIRSERRLCEEVHLNLAYRWFAGLGLDGKVPDHSTFSRNRHGRFRESDLLRRVFEKVVRRCIDEGLVGGEGFAVDASLIQADANKQRSIPSDEWDPADLPPDALQAVKEYLSTLDDAAFGAASEVVPKFISPSDPAAQWTGAHRGPAFFAYATNYLIDTDNAIIVDVEASRAIRQAEVGAARTMIERVMDRFGLYPEHLAGDSAYGAAEMVGWLVEEQGIEPHVAIIDKSERKDGTFSRSDFFYDQEDDVYICPENKMLTTTGTLMNEGTTILYRASKADCSACPLKAVCCPKAPARKVPRSIHERAKDMARAIAETDAGEASRKDRKKVEMLFAHLKRILKLGRLRLRGPCGASDEFLLAATAQNLRKLAKLRPKLEPTAALAYQQRRVERLWTLKNNKPGKSPAPRLRLHPTSRIKASTKTDFLNEIGTECERGLALLAAENRRSAGTASSFSSAWPIIARNAMCRRAGPPELYTAQCQSLLNYPNEYEHSDPKSLVADMFNDFDLEPIDAIVRKKVKEGDQPVALLMLGTFFCSVRP